MATNADVTIDRVGSTLIRASEHRQLIKLMIRIPEAIAPARYASRRKHCQGLLNSRMVRVKRRVDCARDTANTVPYLRSYLRNCVRF